MRRPPKYPSSMFMYLYPASRSPVDAMASACPFMMSSLMFSAKVFHELQPIVGVSCALTLRPARHRTERKSLLTMCSTRCDKVSLNNIHSSTCRFSRTHERKGRGFA